LKNTQLENSNDTYNPKGTQTQNKKQKNHQALNTIMIITTTTHIPPEFGFCTTSTASPSSSSSLPIPELLQHI
jgi:hypothetical protein